jgi:hypothetical protein
MVDGGEVEAEVEVRSMDEKVVEGYWIDVSSTSESVKSCKCASRIFTSRSLQVFA